MEKKQKIILAVAAVFAILCVCMCCLISWYIYELKLSYSDGNYIFKVISTPSDWVTSTPNSNRIIATARPTDIPPTTPINLGNAKDYLRGSLNCRVGSNGDYDVSGFIKNTSNYKIIVTISTYGTFGNSAQVTLAPNDSQYFSQTLGFDSTGLELRCAADVTAEWAP